MNEVSIDMLWMVDGQQYNFKKLSEMLLKIGIERFLLDLISRIQGAAGNENCPILVFSLGDQIASNRVVYIWSELNKCSHA